MGSVGVVWTGNATAGDLEFTEDGAVKGILCGTEAELRRANEIKLLETLSARVPKEPLRTPNPISEVAQGQPCRVCMAMTRLPRHPLHRLFTQEIPRGWHKSGASC